MSAYFLLISILLPIICPLITRFIKIDGKKKDVINLIAIIINSIFTFILLFLVNEKECYLFKFNEDLQIHLKLDGIGKIFAGMVALLWPFAYLYKIGYMKNEDEKKNYATYYTITFGIVLGIAFSGNLVTMFLFYEILTLITIPLIIQPMTKEAKRAGRFYLYISLFGSTIALIGIILLIVMFRNNSFLNVTEANGYIETYKANKAYAYLAYMLMFIGFGVKAAIFPLHLWLPRASCAPTPTTALLHAVAVVKSGAFAIIRVIYSTFGYEFLSGSVVQIVTMFFAIITIIFGSMMAVKQTHLKRRFAYSTISNISYIILAATIMSELGLYAAMIHLLFHSFAKIAIFFVVGAWNNEGKITVIEQVDGIAKKVPITFVCFMIAGFSIVGIPLFAGFISKWQIIVASINNMTWYSFVGVITLLFSALLTAIYVIEVVIRGYFKKPSEFNLENYEKVTEKRVSYLIPIITFSALSLLLGIVSSPLLQLVENLLMGGL